MQLTPLPGDDYSEHAHLICSYAAELTVMRLSAVLQYSTTA